MSECVIRPDREPIDGGAGDQGWEAAQALAEGIADGGEAEDHVEVLADLADG